MSIKVAFKPLKPNSVITYLKAKKLKLSYDYDELNYEAHHKAFTVAKVTKLDLLKDIHEALTKAIEDGIPYKDFEKNIKPTLQKKGWWGYKDIKNPKTGEIKKVHIGSRRLKNILVTNRNVAYTQGRYKQQAGFKYAIYLKYHALHYGNRRKSHQKKDNIILHRDDPWWDINYPPNGWGCKCYTTAHSKKELERRGWSIQTSKLDNIASKDWAYHVGKTDNIKSLYKQKLNNLDNKALKKEALKEFSNLEKEFLNKTGKKQLKTMINEVIVKNNITYPINYIKVGFITQNLKNFVKKYLNKDIEKSDIILHKNNLHHSRPKRKDKYNHSFRVEEMEQLIDILQDENLAYIDYAHNNIVFAFKDIKDETKINLIPIELLKKIKKFNKECYVITLDKQKKEDFQALIKGGFIKKIK